VFSIPDDGRFLHTHLLLMHQRLHLHLLPGGVLAAAAAAGGGSVSVCWGSLLLSITPHTMPISM
jgi:hypothetical protein